MMTKQELVKRYIIFLIGLIITAFGVAFATKASLGTSPIAAIPYSLSLVLPWLTFGNWAIVFAFVLIGSQIVLLGKEAKKIELMLQVVFAVCFGYLIDLSMFCLKSFQPEVYSMKIVSLLIGCTIIAFGAYLQLTADVVMLHGDAFVRAIARVLNREYGGVRVVSDVIMTVIAGVICLVFLHKLVGVREGTIIAALITGNIVKIFVKCLKPLTNVLVSQRSEG
ncbi:MAG: YitT family protein [Firmicutes bacterium]|nr:YitT family protein [Bacillota bacterium]